MMSAKENRNGDSMFGILSESILKDIYGTLGNLEKSCNKSKECWDKSKVDWEEMSTNENQKPYKPYLGENFNGLMFAGINLNGGNNDINAIDHLVNGTENVKGAGVLNGAKDYLREGRYRIFKQNGYGGSSFYYYVPLLSFLYYSYSNFNRKFTKEEDLTREEKVSGFEYCGLTNLIKCSTNSSDGRSKPSKPMYDNCIKKFEKELGIINPKALVIFTFFNYPSLLADKFVGFSEIPKDESYTPKKMRYRVQRKKDLYVLELEHPLSTAITRERKFQTYSDAIYKLVDLQKKIIT